MNKKFGSLAVLVIALCFMLAACGKSESVKNVEMLIADLPALSMENYDELVYARDKIDAVKAEYNALSEKEKSQVENIDVLDYERLRLYQNEYKEVAIFIQYMNMNVDYVVSGNVTIWDNVGSSDFFNYQDNVLTVGEIGYDGMKAKYGEEDAFYAFWVAGYAVDKEYFGKNFDYFSSSKIAETEDKCKAYVQSIKNVEDSHETIKVVISLMVNDFSKDHSSEMDALQNWWIESSLYADHALNPSGSLNSYVSAVYVYQDNIQRYQKIAGY
ncbi:MAG: hypothetical protein E7420_01260 [Ruminococcaceae bacterium]|nr:hypothetical protein [Oscillospiraceae bacterium]